MTIFSTFIYKSLAVGRRFGKFPTDVPSQKLLQTKIDWPDLCAGIASQPRANFLTTPPPCLPAFLKCGLRKLLTPTDLPSFSYL